LGRAFKKKNFFDSHAFTSQEAVDYYTKLCTARESINGHFAPNTRLSKVFVTEGDTWANMKDLENQKA
jgi:hypothetical protein